MIAGSVDTVRSAELEASQRVERKEVARVETLSGRACCYFEKEDVFAMELGKQGPILRILLGKKYFGGLDAWIHILALHDSIFGIYIGHYDMSR